MMLPEEWKKPSGDPQIHHFGQENRGSEGKFGKARPAKVMQKVRDGAGISSLPPDFQGPVTL